METAVNMREYRIMYFFGIWITKAKIYAETDAEAIFDAQEYADELRHWQYDVALFCGNRRVMSYAHG